MDKTTKKYDACTPVKGPAFTTAARNIVSLQADKLAVRDKCCEESDTDCLGSVGWGEYNYYKKVIDGTINQCVTLTIDPENVQCEK